MKIDRLDPINHFQQSALASHGLGFFAPVLASTLYLGFFLDFGGLPKKLICPVPVPPVPVPCPVPPVLVPKTPDPQKH